jgi:hypothetical protein
MGLQFSALTGKEIYVYCRAINHAAVFHGGMLYLAGGRSDYEQH